MEEYLTDKYGMSFYHLGEKTFRTDRETHYKKGSEYNYEWVPKKNIKDIEDLIEQAPSSFTHF